MNLDELKSMHSKAILSKDLSLQLDFIDELLKNNEEEVLEFHYNLLEDQSDERLFQYLRSSFKKREDKGKLFLLKKISTESNLGLKLEALHILGGMKCSEIKPIAYELLGEEDYNCQYKAIIVLGWIGDSNDISILSIEMNNNNNEKLRAFSASALRQIWHNNKRLAKKILTQYLKVLKKNEEEIVLGTVLVSAQEILKKKFGMKESRFGKISGNIELAKPKAIKAVNNFLK